MNLSARSESSSRPLHQREWVALVAVLGVATIVRGVGLGSASIWLDEAASHHFAGLRWFQLVDQLRLDSGPPLYYLLLGAWQGLIGDTEVALRALSALLGVGAVTVTFVVARRGFGTPAGLRAALLLAVAPVPVFYAHQARAYTLLTLTSLIAVAALARWLDNGRRRDAVLSCVALTAALYTHNYGLFLLPALTVALLTVGVGRQRSQGGFGIVAVAGVAYAPWGFAVLGAQTANSAPTAWMGLVWDANGVLGSLFGSLRALSPGAHQEPYVALAPVPWAAPWIAVPIGALLMLGVIATARHVRGAPKAHVASACVLGVAFVPLVTALVASSISTPVYLPGRLDQLVAPAMMIVLTLGIGAIPGRTARAITLTAIVLLSTAALVPYLRTAPDSLEGPSDRALAQTVAGELQAGDAIVTTGLTRAPLAYHLRDQDGSPFHSFPADVARHLGNLDAEAALADRPALEREARALLEHIAATRGWSGRIVLVFVPDALGIVLLDAINADPRQRRDQVLGDFEQSRLGVPVRVFLLDYR